MIRKALFKGTWYPSCGETLDRIVNVAGSGEYVSAVLPHSGLYYSGPLISDFFRNLSPGIMKILIISPSHYFMLEKDTLYTSSHTLSETPYGSLETIAFPVSGVKFDNALEREHGIEMFLPFVKRKGLSVSYALLSSFSSLSEVERMAEKFLAILDDETAIIASSDFTHYGKRFGYMIYGEDAHAKVISHDYEIASLIAQGMVDDVFAVHERTSICGIAPQMLLSMIMKRKGCIGKVGGHYSSNDVYDAGSLDFVSYFDVFWSRK